MAGNNVELEQQLEEEDLQSTPNKGQNCNAPPGANVPFGLFAAGWQGGFETFPHPPVLHISNTNAHIPPRLLSV